MPKAKKKEDAATTALSQQEQIALLGIRYSDIKESIKGLESEGKKIRVPLEGYLKDKESNKEVVTHADVDVVLKYTERVGKNVKEGALEYLKAKGLTECVKVVETVDAVAVERLVMAGTLNEDDVSHIYEAKVSKAFSVDVKRRFDI